jgi:hypothetical protein
MSSLKPEDAVPDYSQLPANERKVLDDWHSFFQCVALFPHSKILIDLTLKFCTGNGIMLLGKSLISHLLWRTSKGCSSWFVIGNTYKSSLL